MTKRVAHAGMVGCVILAGVVMFAGCRRADDVVPGDATDDASVVTESVQPGTPAQAVLVAPAPSDMDTEEGQVLESDPKRARKRSYVSLTEERDKGVYHITLQDPYAEMFDTGEGMVVRVRGGGARRKPGSPDIGGMVWVLPGKAGFNLMPTVTDAAFASATQGVDIAAIAVPQQDSDEETDAPVFTRERSPEIYGQNALFPSHVVRVQEVWVGTNKMVRLVVNPIQYNPITKELRLCYRLKANLEYVKALVPEG